MAKSLCLYQSWSLLCCGNSFGSAVCLFLAYWRHGGYLFLCISLYLSVSHTQMTRLLLKVFLCHKQGLWMGIICGLSIQIIALVTVIATTNWDHEVSQFS